MFQIQGFHLSVSIDSHKRTNVTKYIWLYPTPFRTTHNLHKQQKARDQHSSQYIPPLPSFPARACFSAVSCSTRQSTVPGDGGLEYPEGLRYDDQGGRKRSSSSNSFSNTVRDETSAQVGRTCPRRISLSSRASPYFLRVCGAADQRSGPGWAWSGSQRLQCHWRVSAFLVDIHRSNAQKCVFVKQV